MHIIAGCATSHSCIMLLVTAIFFIVNKAVASGDDIIIASFAITSTSELLAELL